MTRARLVAVGDNCLDVYQTWGCVTVGGNALNVAAQWRGRGLDARYLGAVGTDDESLLVLDGVAAVRLAVKDVQRLPGETGVTLIDHEHGDRNFLHESFGVSYRYRPPDERFGELLAADWTHVGTSADPELVRRLAAAGAAFSVDVSTAHDAVPLDGVPLVFASCPETSPRPAEAVARAMRDEGAHAVVVTRGRLGAYFFGDAVAHAPVVPVDPVDTCGAGDSFIAEFLAARVVEGVDVPAALDRSAAAASTTCGHVGGYPQRARPIPRWLLDRHTTHQGGHA